MIKATPRGKANMGKADAGERYPSYICQNAMLGVKTRKISTVYRLFTKKSRFGLDKWPKKGYIISVV